MEKAPGSSGGAGTACARLRRAARVDGSDSDHPRLRRHTSGCRVAPQTDRADGSQTAAASRQDERLSPRAWTGSSSPVSAPPLGRPDPSNRAGTRCRYRSQPESHSLPALLVGARTGARGTGARGPVNDTQAQQRPRQAASLRQMSARLRFSVSSRAEKAVLTRSAWAGNSPSTSERPAGVRSTAAARRS